MTESKTTSNNGVLNTPNSFPADLYRPGSVVWAKLSGFPFWPAQVTDVSRVPPNVVKAKPSGSKHFVVMFFGTRDFGWINKDDILPFQENKQRLGKKLKSKDFLKAIQEAESPEAFVPVKISVNEEQDDDDVDDYEKRSKASAPASKKRKSLKDKIRDSLAENSAAETNKNKKAKHDESTPATKPSTPSSSTRAEKTPHEKLMRLRMKLQKFMQQTEPRTEVDYAKAHGYLSEAEAFPVTPELLRTTKIPKVLKYLLRTELERKYDLIPRSKVLLEKWKPLLEQESDHTHTSQNHDSPSVTNLATGVDDSTNGDSIHEVDSSLPPQPPATNGEPRRDGSVETAESSGTVRQRLAILRTTLERYLEDGTTSLHPKETSIRACIQELEGISLQQLQQENNQNKEPVSSQKLLKESGILGTLSRIAESEDIFSDPSLAFRALALLDSWNVKL